MKYLTKDEVQRLVVCVAQSEDKDDSQNDGIVCSICGSKRRVLDHHTSWEPETIIPVCRSCHVKIHKGKGLEKYLPPTQPEKEERSPRYYTNSKDGHTKHWEKANRKRDLLLIQLGLVIGCRVSEIVSIKVKNIEPDRIKIWDEKKDKYRDVVIDSETRALLKDFLEDGWVAEPHVPHQLFYFSTKTANRILKRYCKKAGIPDEKAHWHTLRHTYVVLSLDAGVPINHVCEQTGDSPSTIISVYGRPSIDSRLQMIERYRIGGENRPVSTEESKNEHG